MEPPSYTWPWESRPGLKFLGLDQPEHACGLGLDRRFRLDGCAGSVQGLRNVPNKEEARHEARNPMGICCHGPGLGQNSRPDGRAEPGLGLGFLRQALLGPARSPARPEARPDPNYAQVYSEHMLRPKKLYKYKIRFKIFTIRTFFHGLSEFSLQKILFFCSFLLMANLCFRSLGTTVHRYKGHRYVQCHKILIFTSYILDKTLDKDARVTCTFDSAELLFAFRRLTS
jgi:hypothetical protein